LIWFTSDNHFHHKKILHFCPKRAKSVSEMNEIMIKNWNDRVKKRDTIYVIGDFAFAGKELTTQTLKRLNGRKILIKGNHDKHAKWMLEAGFDEVHENIFIYLNDGEDRYKIFLSHFPYQPTFRMWLKHKFLGGYWDTRYMHKRIMDQGEWLLHGHTHARKKRKGRMIHVGVDAWDLKPIPHTTILKIIKENS